MEEGGSESEDDVQNTEPEDGPQPGDGPSIGENGNQNKSATQLSNL